MRIKIFITAYSVGLLFYAVAVSAAPGDGAPSNIQLFDTNQNGKIDRITIDVANPNLQTWQVNGGLPYGFSITQNGTSLGITAVTVTSPSTNPAVIQISVSESGAVFDTSGVLTNPVEVAYTPTGSWNTGSNVNDGVDEQVGAIASGDGSAAATEADRMRPLLQSATYGDFNNDGRIDTFSLTWSEPVRVSGSLASHWTITAGSIGAVFSSAPGDTVYRTTTQIAVGGNDSMTGGATNPTLIYKGDGSGAIADAANNGAASSDVITVTDAARPRIMKAERMDTEGDGQLDFIRLTFSESVVITDAGPENDLIIKSGNRTLALASGSYSRTTTSQAYELQDAPENEPHLSLTVSYDVEGGGSIKDTVGNEIADNATVTVDPVLFLVSAEAEPRSLQASETGFVDLRFTPRGVLKKDAKIKLKFPPSFTLATSINPSCPQITGGVQGAVANNVLTISRITGTGGPELPGNVQYTCSFGGVRNPDTGGKAADYLIEITSTDDVVLEYGSITGDTFIGAPAPTGPTAPQQPQITINDGAASTTSSEVTLGLLATNAPTEMLVANTSDFSGASWQAYTTLLRGWKLAAGTGTRMVYVKFRNASGESGFVSDSITVLGEGTVSSEVSYTDPKDRNALLTRFTVSADPSCESTYLPLIQSDLSVFGVVMSADRVADLVNYVCYGISDATRALGSGERRAVLRDYLQITRFSDIRWDDMARIAAGIKPVSRNLTQEQLTVSSALPVFRILFGHSPVFSVPAEDLGWNTLLYRIRFTRDLTKEVVGISKFKNAFRRTPTSPLDWAAVRVYAYVQ